MTTIPHDPLASLDDHVSGTTHYGLNGEPISFRRWVEIYGDSRRFVARDVVRSAQGPVEVSSIWLGIDHGWGFSEDPVIFETMTFSRAVESDQWRWTTWERALAGHREICDELAQSWWLNLGGRA